jgi:hypothetical protein
MTTFAAVVVVATGLVKAIYTQVLFADGSSYSVEIVGGRWFFQIPHREFATWIMQSPAVFAVRVINVHSYHVLALLLGFGYFVVPVLVCALAIFVARRHRTPLLFASIATATLICVSSGMLMECTFATALFILGATILLLPQRLTIGLMVALMAVGVIGLSCYESFAALAPILAVLLFIRERRSDTSSPVIFVALAYLLLAVVTAVNFYALFGPNVNGARDSLVAGATHFSDYAPASRHDIIWTVVLLMILSVIAFLGCLNRMPKVALIVLGIVGALTALSPLVLHTSILPGDSFHLRGDAAALVAVTALLFGVHLLLRGSHAPLSASWGMVAATVFATFAMANSLVVATGWSQYQHQFANSMASTQGSVVATSLDVDSTLAQSFGWSWTNSTLGVTLAIRQGRVGVVNPPGTPPPPSQLIADVDAYAADPSLSTLPLVLHGYRW